MVNTILGILLIVTFIGLIIYCMKGGNLLVGFLVTAILWCIIAQVPMQTVVLKQVFVPPVLKFR
jgi:hypothetical protein